MASAEHGKGHKKALALISANACETRRGWGPWDQKCCAEFLPRRWAQRRTNGHYPNMVKNAGHWPNRQPRTQGRARGRLGFLQFSGHFQNDHDNDGKGGEALGKVGGPSDCRAAAVHAMPHTFKLLLIRGLFSVHAIHVRLRRCRLLAWPALDESRLTLFCRRVLPAWRRGAMGNYSWPKQCDN